MGESDANRVIARLDAFELATEKRLTTLETELRLIREQRSAERSGRASWPHVVSAIAAIAAVALSLIVAAATLG